MVGKGGQIACSFTCERRGEAFSKRSARKSAVSPKCTGHREKVGFIPDERKEKTLPVEEHKNNEEAAIRRIRRGTSRQGP